MATATTELLSLEQITDHPLCAGVIRHEGPAADHDYRHLLFAADNRDDFDGGHNDGDLSALASSYIRDGLRFVVELFPAPPEPQRWDEVEDDLIGFAGQFWSRY